jgi:hypothetical protein
LGSTSLISDQRGTLEKAVDLPWEALISSILKPVFLIKKRNTVSGPVTQQVWNYYLENFDDGIRVYSA